MRNGDAAVAAIKYALYSGESDSDTFLRLWFEGNFDAIRREWNNVPDEVFAGADPLISVPQENNLRQAAVEAYALLIDISAQFRLASCDQVINNLRKALGAK